MHHSPQWPRLRGRYVVLIRDQPLSWQWRWGQQGGESVSCESVGIRDMLRGSAALGPRASWQPRVPGQWRGRVQPAARRCRPCGRQPATGGTRMTRLLTLAALFSVDFQKFRFTETRNQKPEHLAKAKPKRQEKARSVRRACIWSEANVVPLPSSSSPARPLRALRNCR